MDVVIILIIGFALYFLPSIVANLRKHANHNSITLLNLFLGWTIIGWVVALVWAASNSAKPQPVIGPPENVADWKTCRFCAEKVRVNAIKCKHCGSDLIAEAPVPARNVDASPSE